jgi:very-short-patch-repair endonuclease
MWLFYSVDQDDLSVSCLRRRLLDFFDNSMPQEIAGIKSDELKRSATQDNRSVVKPPFPFESWFEVDVALELLHKGFVVNPQFEVAGKRIDLVVEGGQARLGVECDGDKWHGADRYEDDMQRQRRLERCGWEFFRVRESAFYANKEASLQTLWSLLEDRGIFPGSCFGDPRPKENIVAQDVEEENEDEQDFQESDIDETEEKGDHLNYDNSTEHVEDIPESSGRRVEEVTAKEIQNAIVHALSLCPNHSCTMHSLASRVLKEVGVLTRGNPRKIFERRVMRSLNVLEEQGMVEKYKAKNNRVRLLIS